MMKRKLVSYITFGALAAMVVVSCKRDKGCGESNISEAGDDDSHNMGRNCMQCHTDGGDGEGCFNAAGTAYYGSGSTHSNVVVRLYTQPDGQGTLRATIYGDGKGNFYTTEEIDFSGGLYPAVTGESSEVEYMSSSITTGACNSCHGVSEDKITVN